MRKTMWTALGAACVTGAFGLFFRWLQLLNRFDETTGLYTPGLSGYLFALWCILAAAALYFFSRRCFSGQAAVPEAAVAFGCGRPGRLIGTLCAAILCLGGLIVLFSSGSAVYPRAERVLGLLAVLSGVGFAVQLRQVRAGVRSAGTMTCALMPVILFCYWLVLCYKEHARDPVIWSFCVQILALCVLAVSFYYETGYLAGRVVPSRALWLMLLSVYFCFAVMPDSMPFGRKLVLFAAGASQLYLAGLLLNGWEPSPAAPEDTARV